MRRLKIYAPSGVALRFYGDPPTEEGDALHLRLGSFYSGESRTFHMQALVGPGAAGSELSILGEAICEDIEGRSWKTRSEIRLVYVKADEEADAPKDDALRSRAAASKLEEAKSQALDLEREGCYEESASVMQEAIRSSPEAPFAVLEESADLAERMSEGLSEIERKRQHNLNYKRRQSRK